MNGKAVINALQFKGSQGSTDLSSLLVSKVMWCQCSAFFSQLITYAAGRLWPEQVHLPASFKHRPAAARLSSCCCVQECLKNWPGVRPHLQQLLSNVVSAWQIQTADRQWSTTVQKSILGGFQLRLSVY